MEHGAADLVRELAAVGVTLALTAAGTISPDIRTPEAESAWRDLRPRVVQHKAAIVELLEAIEERAAIMAESAAPVEERNERALLEAARKSTLRAAASLTPEALRLVLDEACAAWSDCMGRYAGELTSVDHERIAAAGRRIDAALARSRRGERVAAYQDAMRALAEWRLATTPLRWLAHGGGPEGFDGGALAEWQWSIYRKEATARGVPEAGLCVGDWRCNGACTIRWEA